MGCGQDGMGFRLDTVRDSSILSVSKKKVHNLH